MVQTSMPHMVANFTSFMLYPGLWLYYRIIQLLKAIPRDKSNL